MIKLGKDSSQGASIVKSFWSFFAEWRSGSFKRAHRLSVRLLATFARIPISSTTAATAAAAANDDGLSVVLTVLVPVLVVLVLLLFVVLGLASELLQLLLRHAITNMYCWRWWGNNFDISHQRAQTCYTLSRRWTTQSAFPATPQRDCLFGCLRC